MQITMLNTRTVSEDGWETRKLEAGQTYQVADEAARLLIRRQQAYQKGCQPPAHVAASPFAFRF